MLKKQMIASARDIVYVKAVKKIAPDTFADASVSINYPDIPPRENYVRCEFIASGHIIKLVSERDSSEPLSLVKMYSESDFKVNVPLFMAKTFASSSIKKHIEGYIKRIKATAA
mmetsp:Transcript_70325/g.81962  ORF Transcript_70325/g.81962 Transcript_70325/m.81962 type:complete len:114 (-) Transcript_70325:200-541(-)